MKSVPFLKVVAAAAGWVMLGSAQAAVLEYEPFDYPASLGGSLSGLSGGVGFGGAWVDSDQPFPNLATTNTSLAYPAGVTLAPIGARIEVMGTATNDPANRPLGTPMNLTTSGQEFYSSALFRRSALTGELTSVLFNDLTNIRWYYGIDTNGFFSVAVNPSDTTQRATTTSLQALPDTTYLLVAKIRTNTGVGQADEVFLRVFAEGSTVIEPANDAGWDLRASGGSGVTLSNVRLALSNVTGQTNQFDELRVGTTFADVAPIPEPSTAASLLVGALGFLRRRRLAQG